ncbi:MAG TPA: hypothetical protein VEA41_08170 [Salinarimonas sp.]|jgi:hypothetical protein|nr:hypothetical protein [Salinarimonas sp.]
MMGKGWLAAAFVFAAGLGAASAQEASRPETGRRPVPTVAAVLDACGPDLKERCGAEPLATGRVAACLRRNEAALAPGCRAFVGERLAAGRAGRETLRPARETATKACEADVKAACGPDLSPRARGACFRRHVDKMSEGCRAAMAELRRLQEQGRQRRAGAN